MAHCMTFEEVIEESKIMAKQNEKNQTQAKELEQMRKAQLQFRYLSDDAFFQALHICEHKSSHAELQRASKSSLVDVIDSFRQEKALLEAENDRIRAENARFIQENALLQAENACIRADNARIRGLVAELNELI